MIDLREAVHLFVLISDGSGVVHTCNRYFTEVTGWRSANLKRKNWFELMVPIEERVPLLAKFRMELANPGTSIHFESTVIGADAREWRVAWDCMALGGENGQLNAVANIGRDITQERALEAQLRHMQRVEGIGRLASSVAHDFNNLLAVIIGYTSQLLNRHSPSDRDYLELSEIRNAAERGAEFNGQLLTFSRLRASRPELLNLNTIVERDLPLLQRSLTNKIELITHLDPSLWVVRANVVEIGQVLLNLIVNARDAMPGGGNVTIASSNRSLRKFHGSVPDGEYVQLTVTDTGTGMSKDALDHLFEPFFTTKDAGKGTGLGLSIVHGIVKQSSGHIQVESVPGRGTSFIILLPRVLDSS
jgi:PAS domain S-box-containing protein